MTRFATDEVCQIHGISHASITKGDRLSFTINGREIGYHCKPYLIAECADAHMGSLDMAKAMAKAAWQSGANAVKFQHHLPDEEMLPGGPTADNLPGEGLYQWLKDHALTLDEHKKLAAYCAELGITYLCTPFSWAAAQEIEPLVPAFKIGSGEAQDFPTLERIAKFGKPMIVSTGMCTQEEVSEIYRFVYARCQDLVLMHCTSEYPPDDEDLNVHRVRYMADRLSCYVGYSCHSPSITAAVAAAALGACVIEKHFTLSHHVDGPDSKVSIDEKLLWELSDHLLAFPTIMGNVKRVNDLEAPVRMWAYRSLVITRDMRAGEIITPDHIWSKRPGTGIPAKRMAEFIGMSVRHDVPANTMLTEDMLQ